jgi:flagellar M-ring protein FliF
MSGLSKFVEQLKQFWFSRTGNQRAFLIGGALLTVAMLTVFARVLSAPDYKPLFKDLDPADAQAMVAQLEAQNIPHQISADGKTVSVPADKVDAARMQTASKAQPHSGRMGFEIFDKVSWGQTEFDEKVAYQRALEGELERSIQTLSEVEQARVHLVMPTDSVFVDRQRAAKASVVLRLRRNGLSKDSVEAISRLVSGAVDELKPEDVSIIDADSNRSFGLGDKGPGSGDEEAKLAERLISTLEPVVGANAIRASVNVSYDQGSIDSNEEKYDPSVSALLSVQRTEDQAGGSAIPAGVPGTTSNVPAAPKKGGSQVTPPNPPTNTQSSKSESAQYGVNKMVVHTITPAGRIQRVTAAVLVDDAVLKTVRDGKVSVTRQKRSQDELNRIQQLAEAAIGFDSKRGDSISVQNLSFDAAGAAADLPTAGWATQVQKAVIDYGAVFKPLSLLALFLLAYLLVLRPMQKHAFAKSELGTGLQPALATANTPSLQGPSTNSLENNHLAAQLKQQTFDLARQNPINTARAIQAWMREEQL